MATSIGSKTRTPSPTTSQYPPDSIPRTWEPENDEALYESLKRSVRQRRTDVDTEVIMVNMGPQHPSTHGVFRIAVALDGEKSCRSSR